MDYTDAQVLLGLTKVSGLGPITILKLVEYVQTTKISLCAFWENIPSLAKGLPISASVSDALMRAHADLELLEMWDKVENKCRVISYLDDEYPESLREIAAFPILLYARGDVTLLHTKCIAVVGTRKVTPYGRLATQHFTKELVHKKYTIVSGFMYGVDAIAHRTAIENNGKTVGVLGYGFEYMYPKNHSKFFQEILDEGGCFISEFPPDIGPIPSNFPQRNRIVAGLSKGVLVTEAAAESGSKITAQNAAEMGREVFAVSGPFTSPFCEGTKQLINLGAKLVTKVEDITEEVERVQSSILSSTEVHDLPLFQQECDSKEEQQIYALLCLSEKEAEEVAKELQLPLSTVLSTLSVMEMNGVITQEKGKYWLAKVS